MVKFYFFPHFGRNVKEATNKILIAFFEKPIGDILLGNSAWNKYRTKTHFLLHFKTVKNIMKKIPNLN